MSDYDETIIEVVSTIWDTMLARPVAALPSEDLPPADLARAVAFTGACTGTVTLSCTEEAAEQFARMFLDADVVDGMDAQDVLGELTNMVAGNLAGVLPQPCVIGLPQPASTVGSGSVGIRTPFSSGDVQFMVDLQITSEGGDRP